MLILLAACGTPADRPPATVRSVAEVAPRAAPHGQARVWPLARGENAFVGRLELDPGAKIPAHRDPTEEYVVVLDGHGEVTIDGQTSPVGPGYAIFMPAGAEVSVENGVDRMTVVQVFAGPAPADRYDGWTATSASPASRFAHEGPFSVRCGDTDCAIVHRGATVAEVWHYADAGAVLAPLHGVLGVPAYAWLVSAHAGDGCPAVYRVLCLVGDASVITETFGNCEEPDAVRVVDGRVELHFPDPGIPERPEQRVVVDPRTCALDPLPTASPAAGTRR